MDPNQYDFSERMQVSEVIQKDVSFISSALVPNAPGDNRVANVLAGLQHKTVMSDGLDTMDAFYNSLVGELSVVTKKARSMHEHQADSIKQLQNIRESISGVSLDEETLKMIEYQKAFDASAKLIRTTDDMLETVMNLKR
jgi:flagellar hook-associated protein 1 FlgK